MNTSTRILFIVNPAGFGGLSGDAWQEFLLNWPDKIAPENIAVTTGPGDARSIAAANSDYDLLVAVGGDGTVGEVASGIMDIVEKNVDIANFSVPALAVIPGGAGNDVCRALGISSVGAAADAIKSGRKKPFDLIRVDCMHGDKNVRRYAMMFANVGFSSSAFATPLLKRLLGGRLAYHFAIFLKLLVHKPPKLAFKSAGKEFIEKKWTILVANIERAGGGGVCLAPGMRFDDGDMKLTIVPNKPKIQMLLAVLPKIAAGKHIDEPDFDYFSATEASVEC
ncbi:MAG: hypothetical protein KAI27_07295, partial [Rhodospirillaceae bacterium]|nr:hypothetical protein [Rhodospirillaceae bacterium]